jgi:hypothetical protein
MNLGPSPAQSVTTPEARARQFMARLTRWQKSPASMSALRCAVRDLHRHRAWPLLGQLTRLEGNPSILRLYESVAGAFGCHPIVTAQGNLGATLGRLASGSPSFERHFLRLLSANTRDQVCDRLLPLIRAAGQRGIPVNYERLFLDLWYWSEPVKQRWAQQFITTLLAP